MYIIQAESGKLYTGITNNLELRFKNHLKQKGARFFNFSRPKEIVFREPHETRSSASKREAQIKKMSRTMKLSLFEDK